MQRSASAEGAGRRATDTHGLTQALQSEFRVHAKDWNPYSLVLVSIAPATSVFGSRLLRGRSGFLIHMHTSVSVL